MEGCIRNGRVEKRMGYTKEQRGVKNIKKNRCKCISRVPAVMEQWLIALKVKGRNNCIKAPNERKPCRKWRVGSRKGVGRGWWWWWDWGEERGVLDWRCGGLSRQQKPFIVRTQETVTKAPERFN